MALTEFAGRARIPAQHDNVFNEECIFTHDSPESPGGLYVCLERFLGFGRDMVERYFKRTDNALFVHIKRRKVPKAVEEDPHDEVPEKVSKMAINVPGGFQVEESKFDVEEQVKIVLLPEFQEFAVDDPQVPLSIQLSAKGVLKADSALKKVQLESASASWEGEQLVESKFAANLEQLNNGVKIPPKGWQCQKCDLSNNLWLNLTDGSILCGRKFFDGSGGNNHAIEHYNDKKYPLAVKLGTISGDGKADVFSYPEDNMVLDSKLVDHLAHFGINASSMTKTDKSMAELEIDINQRMDFSAITESGSNLVPVFGKGLTGMINLGNTCYMNSVLQVLLHTQPFIDAFVKPAPECFDRANLQDPLQDFKLQMSKVAYSLWNGHYSKEAMEGQDAFVENGIRPTSFKALIGRGHSEFSTNRQQDAQEFFLHLLNVMEKAFVKDGNNPAEGFQFEVEDRIECGASGMVKYTTRIEDYIPLGIPMSGAINKAEAEAYQKKKDEAKAKGEIIPEDQVVRPIVPFDLCLQSALEEEEVTNYISPVTKEKTFAKKTMRLLSAPDFMLIQMKKFDLDPHWVPFKLDVEVELPDILDLSVLIKSSPGPREGEREMPVSAEEAAATAPLEPDSAIVNQLLDMGFDINGCKRAAVQTKNAGVEAAMNWVMQHMEDADFAAPFIQEAKAQSAGFVPDPEALVNLTSMGMPEKKCVKALRETGNNVERAIDWIFSHPDDDGSEDIGGAVKDGGQTSRRDKLSNGTPKYKLVAIISHIGSSVHVGHYVCHLLIDGKWTIFNDEKVALSENPPKSLGYLYLYQRI